MSQFQFSDFSEFFWVLRRSVQSDLEKKNNSFKLIR